MVLADTVTYQSTSSDGMLYMQGGTYSADRIATSGYIDDTSPTMRVGQSSVENSVYRSVAMFDTSNIPTNAIISSVTLSLYGAYSGNTTDFVVVIVPGSPLSNPLIAADYYKMYAESANISYSQLWSYAVRYDTYNDFVISSAGFDQIVRGGVTKFGIRSEKDMAGTTPTTNEYVNFYASERGYGYRPKLTVVYTTSGEVTPPESLTIQSASVFTNFRVTGDQIIPILYEINFGDYPTPSYSPQDYFKFQLLDATLNVTAEVAAPVWGWGIASIYLSANNTISSLDTYTVKLVGTDKFSSPVPSVSYTLQSKDWIGEANISFNNWVLNSAAFIQEATGVTLIGNFQGKAALNSAGGALVRAGIPNLDLIKPELFVDTAYGFYNANPSGNPSKSYEDTLKGNLGMNATANFNIVGDEWGFAEGWFGGLFWAFIIMMSAGVVGLVMGMFYGPLGGLMCGTVIGVLVLLAGTLMGVISLTVTIMIAFIVGVIMIWGITQRA